MKDFWNEIDLSEIDTPALIIDRDKLLENITLAISYAGGTEHLRPHVKTHKMLEVSKLQIAAGISKFKCATIAEAEMLGMAGASDVLVAYPVQGPKIDRVIKLVSRYQSTSYSVLVDNQITSSVINNKCKASGISLDVFIDVNNGQNRSGAQLGDVSGLAKNIDLLSNFNLVGLHCYDGHIRIENFDERTKACRSAFKPLLEIHTQLESILKKKLVLVAGGSPSFRIHAEHHNVECSPGTFIFWDERYASKFKDQAFHKAAVVATRIISKIDANTYCLDLGHKRIASEFPLPRVAFLGDFKMKQIGHSEEHLVVQTNEVNSFEPGQTLLAFPYHICPTVALYDYALVMSQGRIIDEWKVTARKRKISI